MRKTVSLGWLLAFGTAGCAVDDVEVDDGLPEAADEVDEGDVGFRNVCSATPDPDWGCRTCGYQNSPIASGYPMSVLMQYIPPGSTAPNQLTGIEDDTNYKNRHPVEVIGSKLVAHTNAWGDLEGQDLVGWSLVVKNGATETLLRIDAFEEKEDWVDCSPIPTYGLLDWVPSGGPDGGSWESVCPGLTGDNTTVVFTAGETYNANGKMKVAEEPDLVTVGCRSHAVAKLKFAGYDPNYAPMGIASNEDERQSGLRMFAAAYCPNSGASYTTTGTPIAFTDPLGFHTSLPLGATLEAIWDQNQALCLDAPRHTTPGCGYSRCSGFYPGGMWKSYNP